MHHYEKTWHNTQPPVKAKLISMYLTSCMTFLALSPEEKKWAQYSETSPACIAHPGTISYTNFREEDRLAVLHVR